MSTAEFFALAAGLAGIVLAQRAGLQATLTDASGSPPSSEVFQLACGKLRQYGHGVGQETPSEYVFEQMLMDLEGEVVWS